MEASRGSAAPARTRSTRELRTVRRDRQCQRHPHPSLILLKPAPSQRTPISTASRWWTTIASRLPLFADRNSPEFKTSWNRIYNNARVYTPDDKAIQTPNSDTPYPYVGADLRAEPIVIAVPAIETGRYFSLQFIDQYTFNFAYVGSRATGNAGGTFLLAGPRWKGAKPDGVTSLIQSETDFVFVLFRTQLFDPADIDKVKAIQAGYRVQTSVGVSGTAGPVR